MPIIPAIGRRSRRLRIVIFCVYAILLLGSVTTVYPFLMMFCTASSSTTDWELYHVPPKYYYDDKYLMAKYLDGKYKRELFDVMKFRHQLEEPYEEVVVAQTRTGIPGLLARVLGVFKRGKEEAAPAQTISRKYGRMIEMLKAFKDFDLGDPGIARRLQDWFEFKKSLPPKYKDTYFHSGTFPIGEADVAFQDYLRRLYPTPMELRRALNEERDEHILIQVPYQAPERHGWYPGPDNRSLEWQKCRETLPLYMMNVMTAKPLYQKYILDTHGKIETLNAAWGTGYKYFWQVPFPDAKPAGAAGKDWEEFVRRKIPLRYVRLDVALCRPSYTRFLQDRYKTVEVYNGKLEDNAASLETAALFEYMPEKSLPLWNWQDYYETTAPIEGILMDSADVRYAQFLRDRYTTVDAVNAAYGTQFASLSDADPPWREDDYYDLQTRKAHVRWDYITRNYAYVFKRIFLMGRPLINTGILVTLVVLSQLTFNPLAAYALSRYRLSYTAKVLIFLLATMAFPAEVSMIPNFIMIRDLGLLNTFAALILPGLASGYYVFLLKGFFDSLPQELYESASIDGASELRMFWNITLPLSMPVLSVIALFSFGGAYGSFLWAFTTCQDKKMWTLMVFLQQFNAEAAYTGQPLIMASLVLAAIPTVIVFLSAQKVLMKGIVVPTMK